MLVGVYVHIPDIEKSILSLETLVWIHSRLPGVFVVRVRSFFVAFLVYNFFFGKTCSVYVYWILIYRFTIFRATVFRDHSSWPPHAMFQPVLLVLFLKFLSLMGPLPVIQGTSLTCRAQLCIQTQRHTNLSSRRYLPAHQMHVKYYHWASRDVQGFFPLLAGRRVILGLEGVQLEVTGHWLHRSVEPDNFDGPRAC